MYQQYLSAKDNPTDKPVSFICNHVVACFRITPEKTSDNSVSRVEHDTMKKQLEGEVSHLTQLLQGALRKQDEMALEATDAWQQVRQKPP